MSTATPLVFRREGLTVTVTPVGSQWAWRAEGTAPFVSGAFPHAKAALKNVFRSLPMLSALAGRDVSDLADELRAASKEAGPTRPDLLSPREVADLAEKESLDLVARLLDYCALSLDTAIIRIETAENSPSLLN